MNDQYDGRTYPRDCIRSTAFDRMHLDGCVRLTDINCFVSITPGTAGSSRPHPINCIRWGSFVRLRPGDGRGSFSQVMDDYRNGCAS